MANKTIAIVDINSFLKQNIESLLFACILEKKVNKLSILDLNNFGQNKLLPEKDKWAKEGEILTTTIFSNTSYQICLSAQPEQNKLINLAHTLHAVSDILIINANNQRHHYNSPFYQFADEVVIFADLEKDIIKNVLNFFMQHDLRKKKILLFVHNYRENIQSEKTYLELLKQFKMLNITICNIDCVPEFGSLKEIEQIDPWTNIYKKINLL